MVTASPKLIEHVLETEQREQQLTLLADEDPSPIAPAASNEASSDVETFAAVRPRGRLRRRYAGDCLMDCEIRLDHIAIPLGRRAVDPDAVVSLKKSIAALGLQHRVTVRRRDDAYVLVAGAHRLEAFRQLGKERIPAPVVDFDEFQAELFEIAENLVRDQLSPAQQAAAFARQKVNYEELHPETKHGAIGKGRVINGAAKAERYTKLAADATGISEAAVQRWAHRGETLGRELLGKIVGTSLDVGTEIDALIKLSAAERSALVDRTISGRPCRPSGLRPCSRSRLIRLRRPMSSHQPPSRAISEVRGPAGRFRCRRS
jgi:hypothetical protein